MTQYVEGATVWHLIGHLDHVEDEATSRCGRVTGEPVEADPDEDDLCGDCVDDLDDEHGE